MARRWIHHEIYEGGKHKQGLCWNKAFSREFLCVNLT